MISLAITLVAVLSVWDYPSRQFQHEGFRAQFLQAVKDGDTATMTETSRKGVKLLPDDPTWHYNLACSLAYGKNPKPALDALEKAIDLGFRDADAIAKDRDFKQISKERRFIELVEYAREMSVRALTYGPNVHVPQTGVTGGSIALGEQNFSWDFENGLLVADLKLAIGEGANAGDLYMNRDDGHSVPNLSGFPGVTTVRLDREGHARMMDLDIPNMIFPYPTFGNASRAYGEPTYWRSLPRMMMTRDAWKMKSFLKLYLSNQLWFFPAHQDCPPVGKFGDVFASICPYFWVSAGSSYTDQPFLRGALEASRSFRKETKKVLVEKGLLAPTIMTLMRKSLKSVVNDVDYLSSAAHPTAFKSGSLDVKKLQKSAAALQPLEIPPLVSVSILAQPTNDRPAWPELTYATAFASAFVLRADDMVRKFRLVAKGAEEIEFSVLRGEKAVKLSKAPFKGVADLEIDRSLMSVTNRIDIGVFGRNDGTGWGAPSYVSFAVVDPSAPYSDPVLTPIGPAAVSAEDQKPQSTSK